MSLEWRTSADQKKHHNFFYRKDHLDFRFNFYFLSTEMSWCGAGRWNGFGGKVEVEETITEAAERELWEEAQSMPVVVLHLILRSMYARVCKSSLLPGEAPPQS